MIGVLRGGEGPIKMDAEFGVMHTRSRQPPSPQMLEGKWWDSPPEPLEGAPPHQQLDLRLLVSTAKREDISVIFSHQVCGNLLWHPKEANTVTSHAF